MRQLSGTATPISSEGEETRIAAAASDLNRRVRAECVHKCVYVLIAFCQSVARASSLWFLAGERARVR